MWATSRGSPVSATRPARTRCPRGSGGGAPPDARAELGMGAWSAPTPRSLRMRMLAPVVDGARRLAAERCRARRRAPSPGSALATPESAWGASQARKSRQDVAPELREIVVREERMRQLEHAALPRRLLEQVAFAAHAAHERHDDLFADRIDRRVRDLRELLLEVAEEQLRARSESTASGMSMPIEPTGSSPPTAIGARIDLRSSRCSRTPAAAGASSSSRERVEARYVVGSDDEVDLVLGDPRAVRLLRGDLRA